MPGFTEEHVKELRKLIPCQDSFLKELSIYPLETATEMGYFNGALYDMIFLLDDSGVLVMNSPVFRYCLKLNKNYVKVEIEILGAWHCSNSTTPVLWVGKKEFQSKIGPWVKDVYENVIKPTYEKWLKEHKPSPPLEVL